MSMDRRKFFKISAATGAGATLAGCGNPETQLIRFIPDDELTPGVAEWRPGICTLCTAGCGLTVRVMEGDVEVTRNGQSGVVTKALAKKLDGNPTHPVSQGRLCVRGQAAIQTTYHPDRISQPLHRVGNRGTGDFEPITWEEALGEFVSQLNALEAGGETRRLLFLTRRLSGQKSTLVRQFLARFGAPEPLIWEVFSDEVLRRANEASFGLYQLPTLDMATSRYVVSFGADVLGTWNSPVAQGVSYGAMRQGRPGIRGKFVQVEVRMSQTGANADEWVPARPGTEGVLALGIAHVIMESGLYAPAAAGRAGRLIQGWSDGLPTYTPEETEQRTGVAADRIRRLAREFAENAPAVAVIAGPALAHTNGFASALAVNALNSLVGSIAQPGGVIFTPDPSPPVSRATGGDLNEIASSMLESDDPPVQVLVLNDTNPAFGAPDSWQVPQALGRVPFIAAFSQFLDETNAYADLILPDHSFLESWVDHIPESGTGFHVRSVAAPVMRPLHDTRAMPDVLLEVGRSLDRPIDLGWVSFEDVLRESFENLPQNGGGWDVWGTARENGGWWRMEAMRRPVQGASPRASVDIAEPDFDGDPQEYPFHLLPYASQAFLDGSLAHLPWLQELPDVLSTAMWSNWLEINPQTASRLGIVTGDLVEVVSAHGRIEAPALVFPGIAPDVVAMPVGQGHENFTRYASGIGSNPLRILAPVSEPETNAMAWAATRVRLNRLGDEGNLILFAGSLTEHPELGR